MKNKFNIFKMTLLSLTVVCLSFSFTKALSNNNLNVILEKSIDVSNINQININLDVDDVTLISTKDTKLKVIEKCSQNMSKENQLSISKKNHDLNIYRNSKLNLNELDDSFKREVIIYLPESYKNNLSLNIIHGNLNLNSAFNLDNLNIILNNGDVNFKDSLISNSLVIQNQIGEININALNSKDLDLSLNTGNINIFNLSGNGYITVTNGDINCDLYDLNGHLELNSSTGDININVKNKIDFSLQSSCDIGKINSDFKNNINSNSNILKTNCGLGNIKINKNF